MYLGDKLATDVMILWRITNSPLSAHPPPQTPTSPMTPLMDMPPNFMAGHQFADTPPTHAVDIDMGGALRRQHSHHMHQQQSQSPQTHSLAGSPQVESMELMLMPSDRPIKQLSELDLELSKLIPKGGVGPQQATSQQQGQVKLYSEVVRQQSITVTTNEPQNVCITTTGDEVSSTKGNEEQQGGNNVLVAPPPLVRKISRFQVSTVVEQQQQMQQMQQQQNQVEEKTVLITQNNATPTQSTATVVQQQPQQQQLQQQPQQQQMPDTNMVYQQQMSKGKGADLGHFIIDVFLG